MALQFPDIEEALTAEGPASPAANGKGLYLPDISTTLNGIAAPEYPPWYGRPLLEGAAQTGRDIVSGAGKVVGAVGEAAGTALSIATSPPIKREKKAPAEKRDVAAEMEAQPIVQRPAEMEGAEGILRGARLVAGVPEGKEPPRPGAGKPRHPESSYTVFDTPSETAQKFLTRSAMGFARGVWNTAKDLVAVEPLLESLTGLETPVGKLAKETWLPRMREIIDQQLSVDDPVFLDQLASGIGSMATFFVPGMGTTVALKAVAKASPTLALWAGSGVHTVLEAATEAGGSYDELQQSGISEPEAARRANRVFWQNMVLLAVTNKFGIYGQGGGIPKRILMSAAMEGAQEFGQEVIQARQEDIDSIFAEPVFTKERLDRYLQAAAVGAILGGGIGGVHAASDRMAARGREPEGPSETPGAPQEPAPETAGRQPEAPAPATEAPRPPAGEVAPAAPGRPVEAPVLDLPPVEGVIGQGQPAAGGFEVVPEPDQAGAPGAPAAVGEIAPEAPAPRPPEPSLAPADVAPGPSSAPPAAPLKGEFTLPRELAGAKPRYNIQDKAYELAFERDLEKGLYIVAQQVPSKRDADYMAALEAHTGLPAPELRRLGGLVRTYMRANLRGREPGEVAIGRMAFIDEEIAKAQAAAKPAAAPPAEPYAELKRYAEGVVAGGGGIKSVTLVGSTAKGAVGRDVDLLYDFGTVGLPSDSQKAADLVTGLIESSSIDLDRHDTFIKADDRYFHVGSGAGRAVIENTEYGREQTGKPSAVLAEVTPAQPKIRGPVGHAGEAVTEAGTKVPFRWRLIEVPDARTSRMPGYPPQYQPRAVGQRADYEAQEWRYAGQLDPEQLGESRLASQGAPLVDPYGNVISGNRRTEAIKKALGPGAKDRAPGQRYYEWLKANHERFGISKADFDKATAPMLVREIDNPALDLVKLAQEANVPSVSAMSASELAGIDAGNLTPDVLALFQPSETGQLNTAQNRGFIRAVFEKVIPKAEHNRYMTADGDINQDGLGRIGNMLFARAYGNPKLNALLAEATDANIKNVIVALRNIAPKIVEVESRIAGRYPDLMLSKPAADAATKLASLRASGQPDAVNNYLSQAGLFPDETLSDMGKNLLALYNGKGGSAKRIQQVLLDYLERVDAAVGHPDQVSMLPPADLDPINFLEAAARKGERNAPEQGAIWPTKPSRGGADLGAPAEAAGGPAIAPAADVPAAAAAGPGQPGEPAVRPPEAGGGERVGHAGEAWLEHDEWLNRLRLANERLEDAKAGINRLEQLEEGGKAASIEEWNTARKELLDAMSAHAAVLSTEPPGGVVTAKGVRAGIQFPGQRVFGSSAADAARKRLWDRLNRPRQEMAIGEEDADAIIDDLVDYGGPVYEAGKRDFETWAADIRSVLGDGVEEYLRPAFEGIRARMEANRGKAAQGPVPEAPVEAPRPAPPAPAGAAQPAAPGPEPGGAPGGLPTGARTASDVERGPQHPGDERTRRIVTARGDVTPVYDESAIPASLAKHLTPAQRQGVAAAIESLKTRGGFLNADMTGVGKTRQALALAKMVNDMGLKAIIVSPQQVVQLRKLKDQWAFSGSYKKDADAMALSVKPWTEGRMEEAQTYLTTYSRFKDMPVDERTVVFWDEAQRMKNVDSETSRTAIRMIRESGGNVFFSATPADKAEHVHYLVEAGLFGKVSVADVYKRMGLIQSKVRTRKGTVLVWQVNPAIGTQKVLERLEGEFSALTAARGMIKHEIALDGVWVQFISIPPPSGAMMVQNKIAMGYANEYGDTMPPIIRATMLQHQRRALETFKVDQVVAGVKATLAEGRRAIVFVSRVNPSEVSIKLRNAPGDMGGGVRFVLHRSEGTVRLVREALAREGVTDLAEAHGGAQGIPEAIADFQSGKKRVIIGTPEVMGTGHNLDDTVGDAPRDIFVVTTPFSAVELVQEIGRGLRMTTRSLPRVHVLFMDLPIDSWGMGIIDRKMRMLNAVVAGEVPALGPGEQGFTEGDFLGGSGVEEMAGEEGLPATPEQEVTPTREGMAVGGPSVTSKGPPALPDIMAPVTIESLRRRVGEAGLEDIRVATHPDNIEDFTKRQLAQIPFISSRVAWETVHGALGSLGIPQNTEALASGGSPPAPATTQTAGPPVPPPKLSQVKRMFGRKAAESPRKDQIIRGLEKAMQMAKAGGLIIQGGVTGKGIRGWFHMITGNMRLRKGTDIHTVGHELGHELQGKTTVPGRMTGLGITNAELLPFGAEMTALTQVQGVAGPKLSEGMAEFVRLYTTDPALARQIAPTFYPWFEARLATKPALEKAVHEYRDAVLELLRLTPEERVSRMIALMDKRPLAERAKEAMSYEELQTQVQEHVFKYLNRWLPFQHLVQLVDPDGTKLPASKDPNKLLRNMASSVAQLHAALMGDPDHPEVPQGHLDPKTDLVIPGTKSYLQILKQAGNQMKDFRIYSVARRIEVGLASPRKLLQTQAEHLLKLGELTSADLVGIRQRMEAKYPHFPGVIDDFKDFGNAFIRWLGGSDLKGTKEIAAIKDSIELYLPLARMMDIPGDPQAAGAFSKKHGFGSGLHRITGESERILRDPFVTYQANLLTIISAVKRNEILARTLDLTENPDLAAGKFLGVQAEKTVTPIKATTVQLSAFRKELEQAFKDAGIPLDILDQLDLNVMATIFRPNLGEVGPDKFVVFRGDKPPAVLQVFNPQLLRSFEILTGRDMAFHAANTDWASRAFAFVMGGSTRMMRRGVVLSPSFFPAHLARELQEMMSAGWGPIPPFFRGVFASREVREKFLAAGGRIFAHRNVSPEALAKNLRDLEDGAWYQGRARREAKYWGEKVIRIFDEQARIGVYIMSTENPRPIDVAAGPKSVSVEGAFQGRTSGVDFDLVGASKAFVQYLRNVVFANPALQGNYRNAGMVRQMFTNPRGRTAKGMYYMAGIMMIAEVLEYLLNKDDPRYQMLTDEQRNMNFYFILPWQRVTGDEWAQMPNIDQAARSNEMFSLPKAYMLGNLWATSPRIILEWANGSEPAIFQRLAKAFWQASRIEMVPTLLKVGAEVAFNKNLYFWRDINKVWEKNLPAHMQARPGGPVSAVELSKAFEKVPGLKVLTPNDIEHITRGLAGYWGQYALSNADRILALTRGGNTGPAMRLADVPGFNRFIARFPPKFSKPQEDFYDFWKESTGALDTLRAMAKRGEPEGKQEAYRKAHEFEIEQLGLALGHAAFLKEQRRALDNIRKEPTMDSDAKANAMDAVFLASLNASRNVMKDLKEHRMAYDKRTTP